MEVECGFLTYHSPMPHFPTIVRYRGQWMPEALITHGGHKRFSDAELASEHWAYCYLWEHQVADDDGYDGGARTREYKRRAMAIERFATAPHYDEEE